VNPPSPRTRGFFSLTGWPRLGLHRTTAILLVVLIAVLVPLTAAAVWLLCQRRRKRAAAAAAAHAKIRPLTLVARHIDTDVERAQQAPAGDDGKGTAMDDDKGTAMVDVSLGEEGEEEAAKAKREAQAKGARGWWRWGKT
jgi:nucleotide-binding universal stress UspA family protein